MQVARFSGPEHEAHVVGWFEARGLSANIVRLRPEVGLVVPGVAAGFLFQTDSPVALIDGVITNPEVDKSTRGDAVRLLFVSLFDLASELGFTEVWGLSTRPEMEVMGRRLGFRIDPERYWFGTKRLR